MGCNFHVLDAPIEKVPLITFTNANLPIRVRSLVTQQPWPSGPVGNLVIFFRASGFGFESLRTEKNRDLELRNAWSCVHQTMRHWTGEYVACIVETTTAGGTV